MTRYDKVTVKDLDLKGRKVLVRADFNVPLDKNSNITDDKRIRAALPTIKHLIDTGAAVILMSHLGRPKKGPEEKFSLKPVAKRLSELLEMDVPIAEDVVGPDAQAKVKSLAPGGVMLLENLRFHKEETANDPAFARELASLGEFYVNDAFGTAHRAHVSTAGLAAFLPSAIGFLIEKEVEVMSKKLDEPDRPFTAVLGGAKVSDKITVVSKLLEKVDNLLIGGAMAFTFIAAKGGKIGSSLCEKDQLDLALDLLKKAEEKGVKVYLPVDVKAAAEFSNDAATQIVDADDIPEGYMGLDIGPESMKIFAEIIKSSKLVVWNGPMGAFEMDNFAEGTRAAAAALAEADCVSIVGGGDSAAAIEQMGFSDKVSHVSTGGGASLELLEGKTLPGIDAVADKNPRRKFICGNRKMNVQLPGEGKELNEATKAAAEKSSALAGIAVPYTNLETAVAAMQYTPVKVLAQNCHFEDSGAFTGEIAAKTLAYMHVWGSVLGHSERRTYFAEHCETVNKKLKAALHWGLRSVICVGESLDVRENNYYADYVTGQVERCLEGISKEQMDFVIFAYEPIWAIGTGKTASPAQAEEVCRAIRDKVEELYDAETAGKLRILYGGSMKPANAEELLAEPDIDGGLIGGACLKAEDFAALIEAGGKA